MRRSSSYIPTRRAESVPDGIAVNHELLTAGGYVEQLMAGSYTLLPLAVRVYHKIETLVREELAKTGAEELKMPLLHPREVWDQTGRWDKAKDVMYQLKAMGGKDFALSFTHEEVLLSVVRSSIQSYKDLPVKLYHFSTKFRQELRPKSGLLRGREFIMKDLYSLHTSKEDFDNYYEEVAKAYDRIFQRLGIPAIRVVAAGGVFTEDHTLEFQVISEVGEDTIYVCENADWATNKEIAKEAETQKCPNCGGKVSLHRSIEVGNNFAFGTEYSEKMGVDFTDAKGAKQFAWFGSYGIGMTRAIATIAEKHHDEKGLLWPTSVAPYQVYLIDINLTDDQRVTVEKLYESLTDAGIEVLWDDRPLSPGQRFAEADLIGLPQRLVVSQKTLENNTAELTSRSGGASQNVALDQLEATLKQKG